MLDRRLGSESFKGLKRLRISMAILIGDSLDESAQSPGVTTRYFEEQVTEVPRKDRSVCIVGTSTSQKVLSFVELEKQP